MRVKLLDNNSCAPNQAYKKKVIMLSEDAAVCLIDLSITYVLQRLLPFDFLFLIFLFLVEPYCRCHSTVR